MERAYAGVIADSRRRKSGPTIAPLRSRFPLLVLAPIPATLGADQRSRLHQVASDISSAGLASATGTKVA